MVGTAGEVRRHRQPFPASPFGACPAAVRPLVSLRHRGHLSLHYGKT
ncbi:hypothetical protein BN2537_1687 [Streptomyces venezuelae]|nr:hypothetical protein BN2537_1687 [Streptomyces venezuelae]